MKRFFTGLIIAAAAASVFVGCKQDDNIYEGPSYIMFSDTLSVVPVTEAGEAVGIPVVATQIKNYDRTFGVEIVPNSESTAIYSRHYVLESNTITIKAGQNVGTVNIVGEYDNIEIGETPEFALRLVSVSDIEWDLYGVDSKVQLKKVCPFDINNFTGYALVSSSFHSSYTGSSNKLVTTELVEGTENTIRINGFYFDGYDLTIRFDNSDILNPAIYLDKTQVIGDTRDAFNWIYGNGQLWVQDYGALTSLFDTCETYAVLYGTVTVKDVGTIGAYANIIEWISDIEAEDYM